MIASRHRGYLPALSQFAILGAAVCMSLVQIAPNFESVETGIEQAAPDKTEPVDHQTAAVHLPSVRDLSRLIGTIGFDLRSVRHGAGAVPRLMLAALPHDLAKIDEIEHRKKLFFSAILPLVLTANEAVARERARLLRLRDQVAAGESLTADDRRWIADLAMRYRAVETQERSDRIVRADIERLLRKVDIVPPSLALAQAAVESGWGSSRFARQGNALFGQRGWNEREGMVPKDREDDASYVVRSYPSLIDSVASYIHNLNSHPSYGQLRSLRAEMRSRGETLDSIRLAGALENYAEIGDEYIDKLRDVIRQNRLAEFDRATLGPALAAALPSRGR